MRELYDYGVLWENTSDEQYMKAMLQKVESLQPLDLILVSYVSLIIWVLLDGYKE